MGVDLVALSDVQTCKLVSLDFVQILKKSERMVDDHELECVHTNVDRVEFNTQTQQRCCDSVDSYKATDVGVDDQHWECEESHLIPVEVHLMKQPSEFRPCEA